MTVAELNYLAIYLVSMLLSLLVGIVALQQRRVSGAGTFAAAAMTQALAVAFAIAEITAESRSDKFLWDSLQWLALAIVSAAYVITALEYTGWARVELRWVWGGLLIAPVVFQVLDLTDVIPGLTRRNLQVIPGDPFSVLDYDFTLLSLIYGVYLMGLAIVAIGILFRHLLRVQPHQRGQVMILLLGPAIPVISGVLVLAGVRLLDQRDTSPIAFAFANVIFAVGLFRLRLFDLLPIAREVVVENLPDPVIVLDAQNRVTDFNRAAETLLGWTTAQAIGQPVTTLLSKWEVMVNRFIDVPRITTEIEITDKDERAFIEVDIAPLRDQQQALKGRVIVLRDITERKEAEIAVHAAREAAERARERAEAADQMKSQFLASMSHELRTPLNSILSFSDLMALGAMGDVNAEQLDALHKVSQSGRHLLALINDVLDITKIQSGMMKLFIEDGFDVRHELTMIAETTRQMLNGKPVTLVTSIADDLPPLTCDKRRTRQILLNLLSNAVKFTDQGTITMRAEMRGSEVVFAVIDTGPGIPKDLQQLVFEPFVRADSGIKHAGGTGLGLPITVSLVEAHGGRMWLESDEERGAAFYVALPLRPRLSAQLPVSSSTIERGAL